MSEQYKNVIDVARMQNDVQARHEAGVFIGSVLGQSLVEVMPVLPTETSLDKLEKAAEGDRQAMLSIATNVHTTLLEWVYKKKNIMQVRAQATDDGQVIQHGHTMRHVNANTLLYRSDSAHLQTLAAIDVLNSFRIESLLKEDALQDYWFVVASAVKEEFSADQADKTGYFGDSMSVALQGTTQDKYGVLIESGFVAGADERDGVRFDNSTLQKIYAYFGVDVTGYTNQEILARPLLIHKSHMPNGISDIAKLYDKFAGSDRFFGVKGATGDYDSFSEECFNRERQYDDLTHIITQRLIEERKTFNVPTDFSERLNNLVKHYLVDRSRQDVSIDISVFGREAAEYLRIAREYAEQGNHEGAQKAMDNAHKTAKGGACATYSAADSYDTDDWSGGSTKKFEKCKSCKSLVFEVGGCDICESCVKKPWVREKAWAEYKKAEALKKKEAHSKKVGAEVLKATNKHFAVAA